MSISQLLAKSSRPPHHLRIIGRGDPSTFKDPILIVGRLMQTFFSQTLTVLRLSNCWDVPLTLFLICPGLKKIRLVLVIASEESYSKFPDEHCSGRELPTLDSLDYRASESIIKQMIMPLPRFNTGVVLWSKLRVLRLCPYEVEEMACLQPILNVACNTLEELHLTKIKIFWPSPDDDGPFPFAGIVNLQNLSRLHTFALYPIFIKSDAQQPMVLYDINLVLSTIPKSNHVTSLAFDFWVDGKRPFRGCLGEDWVGLCDQVIRISGGKHLKMNLDIGVVVSRKEHPPQGQEDLRKRVREKMISLSEYPNICTQFDEHADLDVDSD